MSALYVIPFVSHSLLDVGRADTRCWLLPACSHFIISRHHIKRRLFHRRKTLTLTLSLVSVHRCLQVDSECETMKPLLYFSGGAGAIPLVTLISCCFCLQLNHFSMKKRAGRISNRLSKRFLKSMHLMEVLLHIFHLFSLQLRENHE